jgi:hypothetical protein
MLGDYKHGLESEPSSSGNSASFSITSGCPSRTKTIHIGVVHSYNPRTQEAEGERWRVPGQSELGYLQKHK